MRHLAGKDWRKVCLEFSKRLDTNLGFYYHTSGHDRFYEGERPSFDVPAESKRNSRKQRVRKREQLSQLVFGRATLPAPGARSIRMQYHNVPIELPPPPSTHHVLSDHCYTSQCSKSQICDQIIIMWQHARLLSPPLFKKKMFQQVTNYSDARFY